MRYLRQATNSQSVAIGPFVDPTDQSAETGLTIANTDIKLVVNGGASANKNSGGGTHRVNGVYGITFDSTDTATVGEMMVSVVVAGALPVFTVFRVVEEAVYDAMFAASAPGYVVDQPVNATKIGGTTQTARDIGASVLLSSGTGTGQLDLTSGVVKANVTQYNGSNATSSSGRPEVNATHIGGTIQTTGQDLVANVSTLLSRITSTLFAGITSLAEWLGLMAGKQVGNTTARNELRATGAGSGTYDETTDALQALRDRGDAAWGTATGFSTHSAADVWAAGTRTLTAIDEDNTTLDLDATIRAAVGLAAADLDTQLGALPTAGENADAVWDEDLSGHAGAGSAGEALAAAGTAGDPWTTALPGAYSAGQAGYIIGNGIDATISSRASQTSVNDLPTNAELATALDPIPTAAENADKLLGRNLAGGSDGTRTVQDALRSLRNKTSISGGTLTVCEEDDSTPAWTATVTTTAGDPLSSIDPTGP